MRQGEILKCKGYIVFALYFLTLTTNHIEPTPRPYADSRLNDRAATRCGRGRVAGNPDEPTRGYMFAVGGGCLGS